MENIPELSGFENIKMSSDSHHTLFKRSLNMRDDLNEISLYKRQKISDE
jgi:hypothetical protein